VFVCCETAGGQCVFVFLCVLCGSFGFVCDCVFVCFMTEGLLCVCLL
jgi:hypothetical protein